MLNALPPSGPPGTSATDLQALDLALLEYHGNVLDLMRQKREEDDAEESLELLGVMQSSTDFPPEITSLPPLSATLLAPGLEGHSSLGASNHRSICAAPSSLFNFPTSSPLPPRPSAASFQNRRGAEALSGREGSGLEREKLKSTLSQRKLSVHRAFPLEDDADAKPPEKRARLAEKSSPGGVNLPPGPTLLIPPLSDLTSTSTQVPQQPSHRLRPRALAYLGTEDGQARKRLRDSRRASDFLSKRAEKAEVVETRSQLLLQPRTGEYRGVPRFGNPKPPSRVIPAGPWPLSWPAAVVEQEERRLFVWRSHGYQKAVELDLQIQQAVRKLEATTKPEFQPGHSRGNFTMRQFMVHRSYTSAPRNGAYLLKNASAAEVLAQDLAEVVRLVNKIFKSRFPELYARYEACMLYVVQHASLTDIRIYNLWGVFASLAVNAGGQVWTLDHTDSDNYFAGVCVVVGFGPYDFHRSAQLVIDLGDESVAFELPPAIPLFLPSSIFSHYNTRIVGGDEQRGSLVFWTSGKLFQWVDLGGRCRNDLSAAEYVKWIAGEHERLCTAFGLFPRLPRRSA